MLAFPLLAKRRVPSVQTSDADPIPHAPVKLFSGQFGEVFEGTNKRTRAKVAIKVIAVPRIDELRCTSCGEVVRFSGTSSSTSRMLWPSSLNHLRPSGFLPHFPTTDCFQGNGHLL